MVVETCPNTVTIQHGNDTRATPLQKWRTTIGQTSYLACGRLRSNVPPNLFHLSINTTAALIQ